MNQLLVPPQASVAPDTRNRYSGSWGQAQHRCQSRNIAVANVNPDTRRADR